ERIRACRQHLAEQRVWVQRDRRGQVIQLVRRKQGRSLLRVGRRLLRVGHRHGRVPRCLGKGRGEANQKPAGNCHCPLNVSPTPHGTHLVPPSTLLIQGVLLSSQTDGRTQPIEKKPLMILLELVPWPQPTNAVGMDQPVRGAAGRASCTANHQCGWNGPTGSRCSRASLLLSEG